METRLNDKDSKYAKLKEKYNAKCEEYQKSEKKAKDTLSLKKRVSDLKVKISKLESIKRDLKQSLKLKENELETERIAQKRALIAERKKAKEKGEELGKVRKKLISTEMSLNQMERDLDQSEIDDSRYFSPRRIPKRLKSDDGMMTTDKKTAYSSRALRLDSPTHSNLNMTQNFNESSTNLRSTKRLKSSSPNRSKLMMSTQRIRVGGLGRDRSAKRMIQISTERTNMYDDSHMHCNGSHKYCEA